MTPPPPPDGFVLEQSAPPPPPDGFVLEQGAQQQTQQQPSMLSKAVQFGLKMLPGVDMLTHAPALTKGISDPVEGGVQAIAHGIAAIAPNSDWARQQQQNTDRHINQNEADYKGAFPQSAEESFNRGLGSSLVTAPLMSGVAPAAGALGRLAQSVGMGAASGAAQPVVDAGDDYAAQKLKQTAAGAVVGGVSYPLTAIAGRALAPQTSDAVQLLRNEGVNTTPGQTLGGVFQRAEDAATSIPGLGDVIKNAQRGSVMDFNKAIYNRALAPIGEEFPSNVEVGREGVSYVGDKLSQAYNDLLPKMKVQIDAPFAQSVQEVADMASTLPDNMRSQLQRIIRTNIYDRATPQGLMSGETMKTVESDLGRLAKGYMGSADFDQRQMGSAIRQMQANLRDMMARQNPAEAPTLQAINQGWANLTQIENAASRVGATDGVISPAQFTNAVKKSDYSVRDRAFARGEARNQDLADAAKSVLPSTVPDSGSMTRALFALGAGHLAHPGVGVGMGAAMTPYLPGVRNVVGSLLANRPDAVRSLGQGATSAAPYLGAALTPALLSRLLGQ